MCLGGCQKKQGNGFDGLSLLQNPFGNVQKKVIAVSEFTRQLALKHYAVEIQVIPNGADVLHLVPAEIKLNKPPHLVFAGRFMPQKNPIVIVEVLSQLKDLSWTCSMLGDGPMFAEIKQKIIQRNMLERFNLPGWVTPEDVLHEFSKSDILFMPSLSEGLPVVGVQALAKGLAIVASRIGGFMDLVDHAKNGYLVEVHEVDVFSQALRELISKPQILLRFRKASIEKSRDFDIQKVVGQYQKIILDVVSER